MGLISYRTPFCIWLNPLVPLAGGDDMFNVEHPSDGRALDTQLNRALALLEGPQKEVGA